jgi:acetyltransferase-like isoleucine patch superfamily enzyme
VESSESGVSRSAFKVQEELGQSGSRLDRYMDLVLGRRSLSALVAFELINLLVRNVPGALGLFLRGKLYPLFLGACGPGVVFGPGITFRHPHKIRIGAGAVIDDHCMLDAKGTDNDGIVIEEEVFLGRYTILSCKNGDIILRARSNFGFFCDVSSANRVEVGADTVIAAYVYILSGGNYGLDQLDQPIAHQFDASSAMPTRVGEGSWLGARVTVFEGVTIGRGAAIGAGAVVTRDVPDHGIALGVPARTVRHRSELGRTGEAVGGDATGGEPSGEELGGDALGGAIPGGDAPH